MNKLIPVTLALAALVISLTACGGGDDSAAASLPTEGLSSSVSLLPDQASQQAQARAMYRLPPAEASAYASRIKSEFPAQTKTDTVTSIMVGSAYICANLDHGVWVGDEVTILQRQTGMSHGDTRGFLLEVTQAVCPLFSSQVLALK